MTDADEELVGIEECAKMIGLKPSTVRVDASRRPDVLPPRVRFPRGNRVLWRRGDIRKWVAKQVGR